MTFNGDLRRLLAPALLIAATAVAGCGGSSSSSGSGTNSSAASQDAARVKFAQCMRQNGVDVPDTPGQGGGGPPAGVSQTKLQAAQTACQKYRQSAFGNVTDAQRQAFQDAFAKFASCMRGQGIDMPTPTPGQGRPPGGGGAGGPGGIDRNDPKVQAAQKVCQNLMPQRPGQAGG
ncbi:MAG: hypothetical protein JWM73_625 [Solirubrobacterales bacterium]|nr:hypothetical protein [Solirubrobacterales bacterium]